jgi:cobalt-precorrin-5B (C1)-methyltransferase
MVKKLRSGYTTGACAAAAAKAATTALLTRARSPHIEVIFPDGSIVTFEVHEYLEGDDFVYASVIKDAGDDPDVTNGAVIGAEVRRRDKVQTSANTIEVKGGVGVGTVTKPGLAVEVGKPAINPVPMQMILNNVNEAITNADPAQLINLEVTINVPDGEALAQKTLNKRLGIVGGISILGTTGIVRPVSAEAWTATITSCMDVAEANNIKEIILSTGRTSEKCVQKVLNPREEALVMMGDYLAFSLQEVRRYSFTRVHVATMWAKLLKGAMGYSQTHVRHGVLDTRKVCDFFEEQGLAHELIDRLRTAHTAREIYDIVVGAGADDVIACVCRHAENKYREIAGIPVSIHLVNSSGKLVTVNR